MITTATRLYGVVGWPVAHSRSPAMHNAAFIERGLDAVYLAFPVKPAEFERAITAAAALGVRGLNVTIPYKEAALRLCEPDVVARAVGAVNTLRFEEGGVRGCNTDVAGLHGLLDETQVVSGACALVLGTGGVARAAVVALEERGLGVRVVSRSPRAWQVHERTYPCAPWSDLPRLLEEVDLLIDATPRGLDEQASPIDLRPLRAHAVVLDLVVRRESRLVRDARARGLRARMGATMLLWQGARAFEWWTGMSAPIKAMERALQRTLGEVAKEGP